MLSLRLRSPEELRAFYSIPLQGSQKSQQVLNIGSSVTIQSESFVSHSVYTRSYLSRDSASYLGGRSLETLSSKSQKTIIIEEQLEFENNQEITPRQDSAIPPLEESEEDVPWLESLGHHPYHNLEGTKKIGRIGAWRLKSRRDNSSETAGFKNPAAFILYDNPKLRLDKETLSRIDTPGVTEDEIAHMKIIEDDMDDNFSLVGSPTSSLAPSDRLIGHADNSTRTLFLDFGVDSNVRTSTYSFDNDLDSDSDSDNMMIEDSNTHSLIEETLNKSNPPVEAPTSYYCLFCFRQFHSKEDWKDHEFLEHYSRARDWICMPWGSTDWLEDGDQICVFCGAVDPSPSHLKKHNDKPCCDQPVSERTFVCLEEFQEHLEKVHDQWLLTDNMNKWSFTPLDDYYWQCGFCEHILMTWTDRVRHMNHHFKERHSIACWDPFVPSYPFDRNTGMIKQWCPHEIDRNKLLAQQVERSKFFDEVEVPVSPNISLGLHIDKTVSVSVPGRVHSNNCSAYFDDEKVAIRHDKLWHQPRDVWLCPTKSDVETAAHLQIDPLASYLFPNPSSSPSKDYCPYCEESSEDIFYDLDKDIDECFTDWDVRIAHLESEHNFDGCPGDLMFFRSGQFLLHLVSSHNLRLSRSTKGIMESCRKKEVVLLDAQTSIQKSNPPDVSTSIKKSYPPPVSVESDRED
ncbi:uncharacterized protein LY89DRAFT_239668 [Mollisia scopiformis]|uniref:C2H2-type domain-containing protein n=1 Tax=Mollisia scopiformis TaxID=149040 RepID=A0A194WU67_MOLSC|nr:uncharacterized protein LY89DRAFT_239668 [Mollisia scopiformis]KUJ11219.1 hypothetical protein LY89DRAFT_239668 [Mollisia scopiformis]